MQVGVTEQDDKSTLDTGKGVKISWQNSECELWVHSVGDEMQVKVKSVKTGYTITGCTCCKG